MRTERNIRVKEYLRTYSYTSGVLSGTGEVNVARNGPSFAASCMPSKTVFVFLSRGVLNSPPWPLSSLKSGTGALPRDNEDRMLYLPGRMPGVSGDMKPWDGVGRSGDICPARRGDNAVAGSELVEKKGES